MSNQLVAQFNKQLDSMTAQIATALPIKLDVERLQRIARTEYRLTPALRKCEISSVLGAIVQAAQLGLEPGSHLGHVYLVPYGKQCQLIIGYRGMLMLAHRANIIKSLNAHVVYENDFFEFEYGIEEKLRHIPASGNRGRFHAVYAIAHLKDGGHQIEVMFADEVYKIKSLSKTGNSPASPWSKHFDSMAQKTVVRRLFKYLPISLENPDDVSMIEAAQLDEQGELGEQRNEKVINPDFIEPEQEKEKPNDKGVDALNALLQQKETKHESSDNQGPSRETRE